MHNIGAMIKELRKALGGISQERFAHQLGMTARTISRWEAAEALSPQVLSRLRSIAINVGARDAADFFESKLREEMDWQTDIAGDYARPTLSERKKSKTCSRPALTYNSLDPRVGTIARAIRRKD
jgi:transcriptional regulator with XRE-family HTH domain